MRAARDRLEGSQRRRVIRLRLHDPLQHRRRPRQLRPRLREEPREIEGERPLRLRRARARSRRDATCATSCAQALLRAARAVVPLRRAGRGAPGEDSREPLGDELVLGRLGQRFCVQLRRRDVVREAHLVDLGRAKEEPRPLVGRPPHRRQIAVRGLQRPVVPGGRQDARDLHVGDGVRGIERARRLERLDRVVRRAEPRLLELGQGQPEGDLVVRLGDVVDPRAVRLRRRLPAPRVLVQAGLERARRGVRRLGVDDLGDELQRAGRIDPRQRRRRARLQGEDVDAVVRLLGLVEERPRQRTVVADARRRPRQAKERATVVRRDDEDVLVGAGGAARVAEEVLPQERDLLQVGHPPHRVVRLHRRLPIQLRQPAHFAVDRLRGGRREEARQLIEHLRVARRGDPRGAQVLHGVLRFAEDQLGDVRRLGQRLRTARPLFRARRLREP